MNCPKCGKEIKEGKRFCTLCGYKFQFENKWQNIQNKSENLELQVLIKFAVIAVVVVIAFQFLK